MAVYNDYSNSNISGVNNSIFNEEFDENGLPKFQGDSSLVGSVSWDQRTGQNVEDYITRRLNNSIIGGKYEGTNLILTKGNGEEMPGIPITVAEATYDYGIVFYGLRVNGTVHTETNLLMQYVNDQDTTVEAGVAIRSVAQVLDNINNNNGRFKIVFDFNGLRQESFVRNIDKDYFEYVGDICKLKIPEGTDPETIISWVDVTSLFKKKASDKKISVSFTPPEKDKMQIELNMTIVNEVIKLIYNGDVIVKQNYIQIQFENETTFNNYNLKVFRNSDSIKTIQSSSLIEGLEPGLNQFAIRAEHRDNPKICTDWLRFDVIYTEGFSGTAIAVNGVSPWITNNGVATLYKLYIYSTTREEIELTTYLDNNAPDPSNPQPTQIIKSEFIQASSYNRETNATDELNYKKYIEVESVGSEQFLLIKYKDSVGEHFYKFIKPSYSAYLDKYISNLDPYIQMEIEPCIPEYTYIKKYNISKNYDQITGQINNLFSTKLQQPVNHTLIEDLESSDGWKERDGITYLKLSNQGKSLLTSNIDLSLNDNFTIELGFKTYNISDKSKKILNIGSLTLFPTQIGWDYNEGITSEKFLKRNAQFQENQDTHIIITVTKEWTTTKSDPYYPDYLEGSAQTQFDQNVTSIKLNLMRIYINGCIDREIVLSDSELNEIKQSLLEIEPQSADIDLYLFRVYNSQPLSHSEVIQNYISFLPLKTGELSKESIYNKNDILDESGKISWSKCQGKVNTLLFIYHKDGRFPNRFWGEEDNQSSNKKNKNIPCTLIINYADPNTNLHNGGILDKLQCKGQGSSAMRYLIWNVNSSLNKFKYTPEGSDEEKKAKSKFKPFGQLWSDEGRNDLFLEGTPGTFTSVEGYYPMPTYDGEKDTTDYKYTKMVGKVNFASSMQSHKIGACKLYDDAYKASLGNSLPSGGKKAVHEEPFMYFYIETDVPFDKNDKWSSELDCEHITYDKILELGSQAKFMGFQTWGPGKGDDACSGFDEDITPHYLMLEGGENTDPSVNFQRPWQALQRLRTDFVRDGQTYSYTRDLMSTPTVNKEQSLLDPSAQLLIDDESIVYTTRGAWDIDYGFEEVEVDGAIYYDIPEGGSRESLKVFREFYDTVYKWDFTIEFASNNITEPQESWSQNKKYCVLASTFKINGQTQDHKTGDLYRFDEPSNQWVPAGVYYNNGWEKLNVKDMILEETGENITPSDKNQVYTYLKDIFKKKVSPYLKIEDIAFHQAFIKFLSGTDNRAKNTYFQIIGPLYHEVDGEYVPSGEGDNLIRLIGDDLDTILVTDNNGLQSKPYNLIEDSYDESFYNHWGDVGNLFFRMFDKCYEPEIKTQLGKIINTAGLKPSSVNDKSSYFYKAFFKVQEDFPEIAYNTTATIYYENAQLIKNSAGGQSIYGFTYTNNNVEPIEQSHGSCLQGEKQFMKERVAFLAGYAKDIAGLDNNLVTASSAGGGKALKMKLDFIPTQDFYPTYLYEGGTIKNIGEYDSSSEYDIIKYKALSGVPYSQIINENNTAINQNLFQVNLYKQLSITGLQTNNINGNFSGVTDFTLDNNIITEDTTGLFEDYPVLSLSKFDANLPVVENLNLRNLTLPTELDLSKFYKLRSLDLTGSSVQNVIFPQTGLLAEVILPKSIKTFEIYNNPNLINVSFESTANLETIYIDCGKCKSFNVSEFCENLDNLSLSNVTLRNIPNIYLTEDALYKLLVKTCNLTGEITVIDEVGSTTPKKISFKTKQDLVNKFGNIVTGSNGIKINFSEELIQEQFTCNTEVNAFYDSEKEGTQIFTNLYGINIANGNDVLIIDGPNPFNPELTGYLNITYKLEKSVNNVSVNSTTGAITLTGSAQEATVIITIKTSQSTITNKSRIVFTWSAPKIGDFAYIDGTFSSYYNSAKTLAGLVYAKTGSDDEGTVYIIGKEYTSDSGLYSGYNSGGGNSEASENDIAYYIYETSQYLNKLLPNNAYQPDSSISTGNTEILINGIKSDSYESISEISMTGNYDTNLYISLVNDNLLPKIKSTYSKIKWDGTLGYYIDNISDLNSICKDMEYDSKGSDFDSALIYPYFYSFYLYEPTILDGEQIDKQYKKHNWYAPSVGELSRIIYYRGYSSGGSTFTQKSCRQEIKDVASGNTESTIPIFSLALKTMGQSNFPSVWNNIVGAEDTGSQNNITTTVSGVSSDSDNYSYQVYVSYGTTTTYTSQWVRGQYNTGWGGPSQGQTNGWRYTKHQGIPFVQYNYVNPNN